MSKEKIPDILKFRQDLVDFFKSIDLPYPADNRYEQSFEEIETSLRKESEGKRELSKEAHFRHAVAELGELRFVLSALKTMNVSKDVLHKKFKEIISGERPVDKKSKNPNDDSRNTVFELMLACFLHHHGLNVRYEDGSDISLNFNNKLIAIECKRINGALPNALKDRLRSAYHQLLKRKDEIAFGIIAINIDNVYFNEGKLFLSTHQKIVTPSFYQMIKNFIDKYGSIWQRRSIIKLPEFVPVVLICIRGTVFAFKENETANAFFALVNNTHYPPSGENYETAKALSERLRKDYLWRITKILKTSR